MTKAPFPPGAVLWRARSWSRAVELIGSGVSPVRRTPVRFCAGVFVSLALSSALGAADHPPKDWDVPTNK